MNVVFIGAGQIFWFSSSDYIKPAPKDSKFYVVEPNTKNAEESGLEIISFEKAVEIADLAIIMTPSFLRWEVCEPFILRKIPIVVEKPLCLNWNEISRFEDAAKESWICPVVNIRHLTKIENAKNTIHNPVFVKSYKNRWRSEKYYTDWHGKFATDGGVLAQQGFHCLDLVCWFGGQPISVSAKGENLLHKIECEDTCSAKVNFENGCVGEVYCTTAGAQKYGNDAGLYLCKDSPDSGQLIGFDNKPSGHTILGRKVYHALANNLPPPTTVESVVPSLRALHAAYVSIDNAGEEVPYGTKHPKLGVYK